MDTAGINHPFSKVRLPVVRCAALLRSFALLLDSLRPTTVTAPQDLCHVGSSGYVPRSHVLPVHVANEQIFLRPKTR